MSFLLKVSVIIALSSCSIAMMQYNAPTDEDVEELEEFNGFPSIKAPTFPKLWFENQMTIIALEVETRVRTFENYWKNKWNMKIIEMIRLYRRCACKLCQKLADDLENEHLKKNVDMKKK